MSEKKKKREWYEMALDSTLQTSASAIEMCVSKENGCWRKWWLSKVRKIYTPQKGATTIGDAVHECSERFLKADNLGRDRAGNEVDLFPEGWTTIRNKFNKRKTAELSQGEALMIKRLIQMAITKGILQRTPGREIEKQILEPIGEFEVPCFSCQSTGRIGNKKCPKCKDGTRTIKVTLKGFIDLVEPDAIIDHKTCKIARYAKSKKKLQKDPQMNIYGYCEHGKKGKDEDRVMLRHNQFLKTEVDVKETTTYVTKGHLRDYWGTVVKPTSAKMVELRERAKSWSDIPEPCNPRACQAYGGCPYLPICSGQLSETELEKRYKKQIKALENENSLDIVVNSETVTETTKGEHLMSDMFAKLRSAAPAPKEPAKKEEPKAEVVESKPTPASSKPATSGAFANLQAKVQTEEKPVNPEVVSKEKEVKEAKKKKAPWYHEGCAACKDNPVLGLASNGNPCAICVVNSKQNGGPLATDFTMDSDEKGEIIFVPVKPVEVVEMEAKPEEKETIPVVEKIEAPAEVKEEPKEEEEVLPVAQEPKKTPKKKESGDKDPTFTLLINCTRVKGAKVLFAADLFKEVQDSIAEASGKDYYELDAFKRRDMISGKAKELVEELCKGKTVCALGVSGSGDDYNNFIKAITPYATSLIVAQG